MRVLSVALGAAAACAPIESQPAREPDTSVLAERAERRLASGATKRTAPPAERPADAMQTWSCWFGQLEQAGTLAASSSCYRGREECIENVDRAVARQGVRSSDNPSGFATVTECAAFAFAACFAIRVEPEGFHLSVCSASTLECMREEKWASADGKNVVTGCHVEFASG